MGVDCMPGDWASTLVRKPAPQDSGHPRLYPVQGSWLTYGLQPPVRP